MTCQDYWTGTSHTSWWTRTGVSIVPCYRVFGVSLLPVGRISYQAVQQPRVPPRFTTSSEHQTSDDVIPNPEPHTAATTVQNPGIGVERHVQGSDGTAVLC